MAFLRNRGSVPWSGGKVGGEVENYVILGNVAVEGERATNPAKSETYTNFDLIQNSLIKWSQLYHAYRCNEKCLAIPAHADHLHVSSAVQSNVVGMAVLI